MECLKVITPVDEPTKWVSQIVVAVKKSSELRVCIDLRSLNTVLKRESYQIPVIDDLLPDLTDARVFTKVDLASAFWHLELDRESSMLTTFCYAIWAISWLCSMPMQMQMHIVKVCVAFKPSRGVKSSFMTRNRTLYFSLVFSHSY